MAITFDNTYLTNYSTDATTAAAEKLTGTIQNAVEDEEMLDACKEFEAYMVEQIYKNMEKISKILTDDDEEDKNKEEASDKISITDSDFEKKFLMKKKNCKNVVVKLKKKI